ncbi:MAG: NAD+ synthase [Magnetococcus sp. WYHC-3]
MELILALAQMNSHVGHLEGNLHRMLDFARRARERGAHLVVFPELALPGYPPEDLLHKPSFLDDLAQAEVALHAALGRLGIDALYGVARRSGGELKNMAVWVVEGREVAVAEKWRLPNFAVFDERRWFTPGRECRPHVYRGISLGATICEDIWHADGPMAALARQGAACVINLNASPYQRDKKALRLDLVRRRVAETGVPLVYVNCVGGQDELVFDGGSFCLEADPGAEPLRGRFFAEELSLVRVVRGGAGIRFEPLPPEPGDPAGLAWRELDDMREIHGALCLGLADYVAKNGFSGVVLGLSGGIDSALSAAIAVDALGPKRVRALMMPSEYTSRESLEDAARCARNLGIRLDEVPIGPMQHAFRQALTPLLGGAPVAVTDENIQPRVRATLLMALSNHGGDMLLTTGNKSEMSVGYATLYGDMAGGFSVLKDLLKMTVFQLSEAMNQWAVAAGRALPIPRRILEKPPSAELRPNQRDSDSLPPYPVLDQILHLYVEQDLGLREIVATGLDRDLVARVIRMVDRNEYKRRQSPPGVRITGRAFGKDRRYPLTNGFQVR